MKPHLNIRALDRSFSMATKAKFLEQDKGEITLLDKKVTKHPKIVARLKKIFQKKVL